MSEEKKSITLHIAQQAFKMNIPVEHEEMYRTAERRIHQYMRTLSEKTNITDNFTLLGYAAINFALNEVNLMGKQKFVDNDLKDCLKKIQEVVNEALAKS
ncbi:MAG: cell division protein ZapA [Bacteroidales bacterium]|nr:cell division protein ZapA [Bacteroidales bacterium]